MCVDKGPLIIVSGQPRAGTSLMMRILDVSGLPIQAKEIGSYEYMRTTELSEDNDWILDLPPWTAIKIFYNSLLHLPMSRGYKLIWMSRRAKEQAKSQRRYAKQTRKWEKERFKFILKVESMYPPYFQHKAPNVDFLKVRFEGLVTDPETVGYALSALLDHKIDMSPVVIRDPKVSEMPLGTLEMQPFKKEIEEEECTQSQ